MAGTKNSGRNPKPTKLHVLQGTFDTSRHKGLEDIATGAPVKPEGLSDGAVIIWDFVATNLPDVAKSADSLSLEMMCEAFALYRKVLPLAQIDPTDKPVRAALIAYMERFDKLASRFGMTPSDRMRLRGLGSSAEPVDEFAKKFGLAKKV